MDKSLKKHYSKKVFYDSNMVILVPDKCGNLKEVNMDSLSDTIFYEGLCKEIYNISKYKMDDKLEELLSHFYESKAIDYINIERDSSIENYSICIDEVEEIFLTCTLYKLDYNTIMKNFRLKRWLKVDYSRINKSIDAYLNKSMKKNIQLLDGFNIKRDYTNNNIHLLHNNIDIILNSFYNNNLKTRKIYDINITYLIGNMYNVKDMFGKDKVVFKESLGAEDIMIIMSLNNVKKDDVIDFFDFYDFYYINDNIVGFTKANSFEFLLS